MHSTLYIAALAAAAHCALGRPAPIPSEASSVVDEYVAAASATIGDYIESGISSLDQDDIDSAIDTASDYYHDLDDDLQDGLKNASSWNATNGSWGQHGYGGQQQECMSREDALKVAGTFQSLIQGYTVEQALAALTPNFIDYTSAVSIIINKGGSAPEDVTKPVFTSRDEFMKGHGTQEPIPFETIKVWSTCDGVVSMVWRSIRSGQGQENETAAIPVTGTAVLETEPTSMSTGVELERALAGGYNYRINTLWSEFNTVAWLVNNGVVKLDLEVPVTPVPDTETTPSPPSTITKRRAATSKFNVGLA